MGDPNYLIIKFLDRHIYDAMGPEVLEDIREIIEDGVKNIFGDGCVKRVEMEREFDDPDLNERMKGTDVFYFVLSEREVDEAVLIKHLVNWTREVNDQIDLFNKGRKEGGYIEAPPISEGSFRVMALE